MSGQPLCYSSWLPQLLPAQLVVEITAINHKLLFEITALISPSTGKEKEKKARRVVQGGGTATGWIPLGLVGNRGVPNRTTHNSRCVPSSWIMGGNIREGFSHSSCCPCVRTEGLGVLWGRMGLSWRVQLRWDAGLDPLDEAKVPNPQISATKLKSVDTAQLWHRWSPECSSLQGW